MGEDEQTQMRVQQGRQESFPEFRSEPAYWFYLLLGATARVEFSRWRGEGFQLGRHRWSPDFRKRIILDFSERVYHFKTNPEN